MNLIAFREMTHNLRLWVAAGPLLALTSAMLTVVFSMRSATETAAEEEVGLMDQYDGTLLALVLLSGLATAAVAIRQTALRTRRRTAYFSIAGLNPSVASTGFIQQLMGIAAIFTVLGALLGWAISPFAVELIAWATSGRHDLVGHTDIHAITGAAIITMGLALIASTRGSQVARDVEPIEALKPRPYMPHQYGRRSFIVGFIAAGGAILTAVLAITLPSLERYAYRPIEAANVVAISAGAMAVLLAAFFALAAPLYCPFLIRAWTVFIPERHLPTLFLGRRGAAYQAGRTLEAFNVVLVGALLVGSALSIYFARSSLDPAGRGWVEARDVSGVILAAVPLVLGLTGAILTVLAASRSRTDEARVLCLSGATTRQVLAAGFFEAFILAVTATAVALAGVALVGTCTALGLANVPGSPGWPQTLGFDGPVWWAPLGVTVLGMVLVTAASLPSLIRGLRSPAAWGTLV
ncbi:MAG: hypothetical protein LBH68_01235 [Bifidobacteriaceae bacterium]|jgi:hypothetical protein|nr:hypothetical protein [Bifidobacteriaceae bacterium]